MGSDSVQDGFNRAARPRLLPGRASSPGISLVESSLVLATVAVLLALGLPWLRDFVTGSRVVAGANLLVADLAFARTEALKHAEDTILCESQDGVSCTSQSNWSNGWLIYVNADTDWEFGPGDTLLRVQHLDPAKSFIAFNGSGANGDRYIKYQPDGSAKSGSFFVCDRVQGKQARAVIVQYTGRTKVSDKKSDGGQINCTAS